MAIVAKLPGLNLFSTLPSSPPPSSNANPPPPLPPPIPIPKYPPPLKSRKQPPPSPKPQSNNPALNKSFHSRSKYYKPVRDGVISSDGDRSVVVGESGVSYLLPGAPFEFQFSYSETPKAKPVAIREPAFLPFAPPTMPRPWTGKAPLKSAKEKKRKKKIPLFESLLPPPPNGVKHLEMPKPYHLGDFPAVVKPREKVMGKPLTRAEIRELLRPHISSNRQINLAKNGVYTSLVRDVRNAFEGSPLVKINCEGLHASDYKKIGAKLKILMWRGQGWKSKYPDSRSASIPADNDSENGFNSSGSGSNDGHKSDPKTVTSSPKMMSLWKRALETSKALLLEEITLGPDTLLEKVEEFEGISQATEHSYPALVLSSEDGIRSSREECDDLHNVDQSEADNYSHDNDDDDDGRYFLSDSFEGMESSVPIGSLPVDWIAKQPNEQ